MYYDLCPLVALGVSSINYKKKLPKKAWVFVIVRVEMFQCEIILSNPISKENFRPPLTCQILNFLSFSR
jgi:hypothetical protein